MSDTLPNVVVPAATVIDLYSETGITAGTQISVKMIGSGDAMLYSGATLTERPDNDSGFTPIRGDQELANSGSESGAFIWSDHGCVVNVGEFDGAVVAGSF